MCTRRAIGVHIFRRHLLEQIVQLKPLGNGLNGQTRRPDSEEHGIAFLNLDLLGYSLGNPQGQTIAPFLNRSSHVSTLRLQERFVNSPKALPNVEMRERFLTALSPDSRFPRA